MTNLFFPGFIFGNYNSISVFSVDTMLADYRSAALLQTKAASLNFLQRYIEVSDIIAPGFW